MHSLHQDRQLDTAARNGARRCARLLLTVLALLGIFSSATSLAQGDSDENAGKFKIIVNADNPVESLKASVIARMFIKKVKRWEHGVSVTPIDLSAKIPAREAFTESVHNKSVSAINSFWQRMIFSGREEPPAEKASPEEAVRAVRADPGAISYVPSDTALGSGVKELKISP